MAAPGGKNPKNLTANSDGKLSSSQSEEQEEENH